MSKKRILVVDDAKDILFLITHSVKRLGPDYEVDTATNAFAALEKIEQTPFDLVITDYMMGGMTGLELAEEIGRTAPHTKVVVMSAYDTTQLRDTVSEMGLSGFIGKPFTVGYVMDVVAQAIAEAQQAPPLPPDRPQVANDEVYEVLKMLYAKTGAHYALLLDSQGQPLQAVGNAKPSTLSRLAKFVASSFLSVSELATLMGDNTSTFKSSYYEGSRYNIYAYHVTGQYFLAVVFGVKDKPGSIWFYTKQTAVTLAALLGLDNNPDNIHKTEDSVSVEFDDLLGDEIINGS